MKHDAIGTKKAKPSSAHTSMKTTSTLKLAAITIALSFGISAALADVSSAPQPVGIKDIPKLANPTNLPNLIRNEVRYEQLELRHQLADIRAGKPKALVGLTFTGARLAGVDGGTVTAVKLAYHFATLDDKARNERLDTALPRTIENAPNRGFRRALHSTLRGAVTGNWNVGDAIVHDISGQAIELAPAALNSAGDTAEQISSQLQAPRS
jgi:hypothetical protein